ncbi:FtsX-like permease family protein [Deinococcus sp. SDU3-2]|uniref:FtsX-like permease family protein n=2 Tax=Deinococcaceae TaxID=183710 RepID=A0A7X1TSK4_9DEIO|nr:FtsX-like permease family protein [Deinococcus terrestris]
MIQVFLVVVAAFVMAVFFYVLTLQKTPQFGLLRAIGASTRTLAGSLVAQMLLLTTLAVALAALITLGLVTLLPAGIPFALTPSVLLAASALLIGVAALSSLLSLRSIARVDPLIAIGTVA